jgi:hypothetical protein
LKLTDEIKGAITSLVSGEPMIVPELAERVQKMFKLEIDPRTMARWCEELESEGFVKTKVLREMRSPVTLVYWNWGRDEQDFLEKIKAKITAREHAEEFHPSEIYNAVKSGKKDEDHSYKSGGSLGSALEVASDEILFFGGDYSTTKSFSKEFEEALMDKKRGLKFSGIARVERGNRQNFEFLTKLMERPELRGRLGIRHFEQALRGVIVDQRTVELVEVTPLGKTLIVWKDSTPRPKEEYEYTSYRIWDAKWVAALVRLFWGMYNNGINLNDRLNDLTEPEKKNYGA